MNINLLFTVFLIVAGIAFLAASDQARSLDITKSIQGTVKEEKAGFIVILENSDGKMVKIAADPNTVYNNVQQMADLKAGDKVQVDYQSVQDKKTAITITKMEVEG